MTPFLHEWAVRNGVSLAAVEELKTLMGAGFLHPDLAPTGPAGSETRQQSLIRLAAPKHNLWLTRNNVGALMDRTNRLVRYGLANESDTQNSVVKSSDLIGIHTFTIQPHHVGQQVGQFAAVECKEQGWQYSGDDHEKAQMNFANFVVSKGGCAIFASDPQHLTNISGVKHHGS